MILQNEIQRRISVANIRNWKTDDKYIHIKPNKIRPVFTDEAETCTIGK